METTSSAPFWDWAVTIWPWVLGVMHAVVLTLASAHVILRKRNVRASIAWVGLIVLSPFVGAAAYFFFGVNRIQRRAARITAGTGERRFTPQTDALSREVVARSHGEPMAILSTVVGNATRLPLLGGNQVEPLVDGDAAYPAMRAAIESATRSVAFSSYIFDHDREGKRFVEVLEAAHKRGVEVRVLIDGVGARYSRPPITTALRGAGIPTSVFIPPRIPLPNPYFNLRSHRKLLIVDGSVGFIGGMNIREGCVLTEATADLCQDVHFRVTGPVLDQLFAVLDHDWEFTTGETLSGPAWAIEPGDHGPVACRAVPDGPDETIDTLRRTLLGGLQSARRSVQIVTPYFLPDDVLTAALDMAVMRGVTVDILIPRVNNLKVVRWASTAQLKHVVQPGCRVWRTAPPFDHSKLMVVDDTWSLIGSANWDPRSLRLNFEINLECYDPELAGKIRRIIDKKLEDAEQVLPETLAARPVLSRLRDGAARLLSPYL
ncbi:hypothetical protein ABI59_14015 [Acidobacteria bacterium Mor1]|nr:hypothetical protein ABI59_14015 [Acidobacteria bacterium Mor1]